VVVVAGDVAAAAGELDAVAARMNRVAPGAGDRVARFGGAVAGIMADVAAAVRLLHEQADQAAWESV
jgi:hypothetical protein